MELYQVTLAVSFLALVCAAPATKPQSESTGKDTATDIEQQLDHLKSGSKDVTVFKTSSSHVVNVNGQKEAVENKEETVLGDGQVITNVKQASQSGQGSKLNTMTQVDIPSLGIHRTLYSPAQEMVKKSWGNRQENYFPVPEPNPVADYVTGEEDTPYNVEDLLRQGMIRDRLFRPSFDMEELVASQNREDNTLEEIIYQLARDMFTQNLLRGDTAAEETFSRLASFLETEVAYHRISREMEQKIMSIVTSALIDTLREFPDLMPRQIPKRDPVRKGNFYLANMEPEKTPVETFAKPEPQHSKQGKNEVATNKTPHN